MLRIEQQIGCPCLQDRNEGDDERRRTSRRNDNQIGGANAQTDQAVCKLIGATIKLGIGVDAFTS
jgi:hypothetical protein